MTQGDYAGAAAQFETLGSYSDASQMAMHCKGIMAAESMGMYDAAISAFESLGDFKDSKQLITYYQGRSYQATGDLLAESEKLEDFVNAGNAYNKAMNVYRDLTLFKDCLMRMSACQRGIDNVIEKINAYDYAAADKLEQEGKRVEALQAFALLGEYSDSMERTECLKNDVNRDLKTVGSYVVFGSYPQTKAGTDATPIEWLVLDVQGDKSLLISRYALDWQPYNKEWVDNITWAECTLRTWLNTEFLNQAFSVDEQKAILMTQVDNSSKQNGDESDRYGGKNTQDHVFLLSYAEAWKYFVDDTARKCAPTDYAVRRGGDISESGTCWWWLRSPALLSDSLAGVGPGGSRQNGFISHYLKNQKDFVVRPALWLNLKSDIFKSIDLK